MQSHIIEWNHINKIVNQNKKFLFSPHIAYLYMAMTHWRLQRVKEIIRKCWLLPDESSELRKMWPLINKKNLISSRHLFHSNNFSLQLIVICTKLSQARRKVENGGIQNTLWLRNILRVFSECEITTEKRVPPIFF